MKSALLQSYQPGSKRLKCHDSDLRRKRPYAAAGYQLAGEGVSDAHSWPVAMVRILPPWPISSCQCDTKWLTRLLKTQARPPGQGGSGSSLRENEVRRLPHHMPNGRGWPQGRGLKPAREEGCARSAMLPSEYKHAVFSDLCEKRLPGLRVHQQKICTFLWGALQLAHSFSDNNQVPGGGEGWRTLKCFCLSAI